MGGGNPPIGVYPCKGGGPNDYVYIYTSAANPEHWTRLLKVMGREDLVGDERFNTPAARTERREEVDRIVSEWTIRHDKHTAMELVGGATIPAGAVLDTRELADDPTFAARGIRQTMKHPQVGDYVMSGWPVRFGGQTPQVGPAPLLGQHGEQVLAEWLSYDAARIANLKSNEVIA